MLRDLKKFLVYGAPAGGFFGLQLAAQDSYQHAIVASAAQLLEFLKGLVTGLRRKKLRSAVMLA